MSELSPQNDQSPAQKGSTVTITEIASIDDKMSSEAKASFPSLISFRAGMVPTNMEQVSLTLKKQRRVKSDDSDSNPDNSESVSPELFVETNGGRVWRGEAGFHELFSQHFIGVRQKSTGKMRLIQISAMYNLRPDVSRQASGNIWDEIDEEEDKNEQIDEAKPDSYNKHRELLDAFGGRRSIFRHNRLQRNVISEAKVDEKIAVHIGQAAKEMVEKDAESGIHHNAIETTESSAPPHVTDARSPEDAYPLVGLLSPQELNTLDQNIAMFVDSAQGDASYVNPGWHPLVWDLLLSILGSGEELTEPRQTRMRCAMQLHYLITLKKCPQKITNSVRRQLVEDMAVPETVLLLLMNRFTARQLDYHRQDTRVKSPETSAFIIKHGVIMWLYAKGFSNCGDLHLLAEAFEIDLKTLLWQAMSVGCKVRKLKDSQGPEAYRLTLKVPLVFLPIRKKKGRPQKRLRD